LTLKSNIDWKHAPLSEIADLVKNQINPQDTPDTEFNYLSIGNIESNTGRLIDFSPTKGSEIKSTKHAFTTRDVLYSRLRPNLNKVYLPHFDGICATDMMPLRPKAVIEREFLSFYLRTPTVVEYAVSRIRGIQLPRLSTKDLLRLQIPLPPLSIQKMIVELLTYSNTRTTQAKQELSLIPDLTKRMRMAILSKAFRGELASKESLLERVPYTFNELGGGKSDSLIPKYWDQEPLSSLADVKAGKARTPKNRPKNFPTKYLRVANVYQDRFELDDLKEIEIHPENRNESILRYGDIVLVGDCGSPRHLGRCSIWEDQMDSISFQNHLIRLRCKEIEPEYMKLVIEWFKMNGVFSRMATKASIAHIRISEFANLQVPLPPKEERELIIALSMKTNELIKLITDSSNISLRHLEQLEQSILSRAFEGNLINDGS
jgi:type I restriction enzyme S subunit